MVPIGVQRATAGTVAGAEWQRQAQAAKEQNPEERTGHGEFVSRAEDGEDPRSMGPSLREQQRSGRGGKFRKVRLKRALVASTGCPALPAAQEVLRLVFTVSGDGVVHERLSPGRGLKPLCVQVSRGLHRCREGRQMLSAGVTQQGKEAGRDGWGRRVDDQQCVHPSGPVRRMPVGHSSTQPKTAETEWQASGSCRHGRQRSIRKAK